MPTIDLSAGLFSAEDAAVGPTQLRALPSFPSVMRTWLPMIGSYANVSASAFTLCSLWELECDTDSVRFVYRNNTATAYTIVLSKACFSSTVNNNNDPTNAAGNVDFTLFQQVYFNNAGLDVRPMDQTTYGSGTTTFTVPANAGSLQQPTVWYSDWMRLPSLARLDNPAGGPILMVRTLTDALGTYRVMTLNSPVWAALGVGKKLSGTFFGGDRVTAPSTVPGAPNASFFTPDGVQYNTRVPGVTVLAVGDSLTRGLGTASTFASWAYLSCNALSTLQRPVTLANLGYSAQISSDFWVNGYAAFKATNPDVMTIATWTPNDPFTQVAADTAWARALELSNYAMKAGCVPVLMGPLPWNPITTAAQEAIRLSARTRMLQAGQYGMKILDWEGALGSGAFPNQLQTIYNSLSSANHPNDLGNSVMDAAVFRPVLRDLVR